MNLGIYIETLANTQYLELAGNLINNAIDNEQVSDASIFYDDVGFSPLEIKCGMFNSTDLWNFSGDLITTSLNTTQSAINIVNNIDIYYYHGFEENMKVLELLYVLQNKLEIISNSEESAKEIYRITGRHPVGISHNFQDIIQIIKGSKNGRSKNNRYVCRAE